MNYYLIAALRISMTGGWRGREFGFWGSHTRLLVLTKIVSVTLGALAPKISPLKEI